MHNPDLNEAAPQPGAVVALGNFDGVHRGHAAVIETARALAAERNAPLGVVTFEPHPRQVLRPGTPPFRLTTQAQKARQLKALGVEHQYTIRFDGELAGLPAARFEREILLERLDVKGIVAGRNFLYGCGRTGSFATLQAFGARHDIPVAEAPTARDGQDEPYSSTRIRQALVDARPDHAAALLGRRWEIAHDVEHGDQRGRTLGFPTANGRFGDLLVPAHGIYAVRVRLADGVALGGVSSIGIRPMWKTEQPLIETHLFDFSREIYGEALQVELVEYLRPEMHFSGVPQLIEQIGADCARARDALDRASSVELGPHPL